jgi:hypothetical protein
MRILLPLLIALLAALPASAGQTADISGVWEASHPDGSFQVLSVPDRSSDGGYYFIMLELGTDEKDFGFSIGELLATLTSSGSGCWSGDEKFRLPLSDGGGTYMGATQYCLAGDGHLDFHTDDEAAVFSDYPLTKLANGIDAAGIWQGNAGDLPLDFMLVPVPGDGWKAMLLSDTGNARAGDIFLDGDTAPNADGVDARMKSPGGSEPATVKVVLADPDTLRIGVESGPELGWSWIEFRRVY